MSTNGIIFLVAFVTMVGLIVWVIWASIKEQRKKNSYVQNLPSVAHPWSAFVLGFFLILFGAIFYWYANSWNPDPLNNSGWWSQLKIGAIGISLLGFFGIFRGFQSLYRSKKK